MMIKNLNDEAAVGDASECLNTIVKNIVTNSEAEKFRRIRKENKALSKKVLPVVGCEEFLLAIGFTVIENDKNEECYYMNKKKLDNDILQNGIKLLINTEAIKRQLCRKFQGESLPVKLSPRSRGSLKNAQVTNFVFLNFQFPDQVSSQGAFTCDEKIKDVKHFVREKFDDDAFKLDCYGVGEATLSRNQIVLKNIRCLFPEANARITTNVNVDQNTGAASSLKREIEPDTFNNAAKNASLTSKFRNSFLKTLMNGRFAKN